MLSCDDIERLIMVKRSEIEKEKILLGLSPPPLLQQSDSKTEQITNGASPGPKKRVEIVEPESEHDDTGPCEKERDEDCSPASYRLGDNLPAGLDRYIRRCLGLPVMLKAGEFSPNNPLLRAENSTGDVFFGLGEYERRRNTLRKIQQQQYKEYLDQQAKLKQEAKERAERERKEREEKERLREEKERERLGQEEEKERDRDNQRRAKCFQASCGGTLNVRGKVDTGVQVGITRPLSVAVQTDDSELYPPRAGRAESERTQAERELSPRTADPHDLRVVRPAPWDVADWEHKWTSQGREGPPAMQTARERLTSDLRHTYMPSIFDEDAIQLRNEKANKEAAIRKQYYQQELRNQIEEQQRIREERKNREKLLEQAEMRRLEEQLRMLKTAQDFEIGKHNYIDRKTKENTVEFDKTRTRLQKEIDEEDKKLRNSHHAINRTTISSDCTRSTSKTSMPFYYPKKWERSNDICTKKPFSINIPDNSIFSPNYDVEGYLRKNLNPSKEFLLANKLSEKYDIESIGNEDRNNVLVEKALAYQKAKNKNDNLSSKNPKSQNDELENLDLDKYKVSDLKYFTDDTDDILKESPNKHESIHRNVNNKNNNKVETLNDKLKNTYDDDLLEEYSLKKQESEISRFKSNNEVKEKTEQECVLNKYYSNIGKDEDLIQEYSSNNYQTSLRNINAINNNKEKKASENRLKEFEPSILNDNAVKITEKALIHDRPKEKSRTNNNNIKSIDDIPIPVLKHTPVLKDQSEVSSKLSKGMKLVEDKWKVPAVEKNILKSLPSENGKNVSILTQLGSIRRQLQLEQLRLDNMLPNENE